MIDSAIVAINEKEIFEKKTIIRWVFATPLIHSSYLQELKEGLVLGSTKGNLPSLPARNIARQSIKPKGLFLYYHEEALDTRSNSTVKNITNENKEYKSLSKRPPGVSFLMLDKLRKSTLASFDRCVNGFVEMLRVLSDADPQLSNLSNELISEIFVSPP